MKTRLINNTDNAIYNYLTDRVSKHNVVNMNRVKKTQKAIAEELALDTTAVSKAFKKLKDLHIIDFTKSGTAFEKILISPRILWKKDVKMHSKIIYDLNHLGGADNFRRDPFEVDTAYLKPPEKKKADDAKIAISLDFLRYEIDHAETEEEKREYEELLEKELKLHNT